MKASDFPTWHTAIIGLKEVVDYNELPLTNVATREFFEKNRMPIRGAGPVRRLDLVLLSEEQLGVTYLELQRLADDADGIERLVQKGLSYGLHRAPQEVLLDLVMQPRGTLYFPQSTVVLAGEPIVDELSGKYAIEVVHREGETSLLLGSTSDVAALGEMFGLTLIFARETPQ